MSALKKLADISAEVKDLVLIVGSNTLKRSSRSSSSKVGGMGKGVS